jgi:hypothetical protein
MPSPEARRDVPRAALSPLGNPGAGGDEGRLVDVHNNTSAKSPRRSACFHNVTYHYGHLRRPGLAEAML